MPPARHRRFARFAWWAFAILVAVHGLLVLARVPISLPFDYVIALGTAPMQEALRVEASGRRRVVVLQHGMWRTAASLNRLQRTLREHGYEVCNPGYSSLRGSIEDHATRLHAAVEALHTSPVDELSFVGHSMGGLVVQEYLRRPDARPVTSCVYLAVPHRGAVLADLRKHWFLFRLVMGSEAPLELSPGAAIHSRPIPVPERSGVLVGDIGEGNASIPGHDDGTVAVGEANLPGARDTLVVPFGHTRITLRDEVAIQVLHFLRHGAFSHGGGAR